MSKLTEHAERELLLSGVDEDLYGDMTRLSVMELVEVFAKQGHSGMSGAYVLALFNEVVNFRNLTPLTDDPDEWTAHSEELWQNKRNVSAFSSDCGKTYYIIDDKIEANRKGLDIPMHETEHKEINKMPAKTATRTPTVKHKLYTRIDGKVQVRAIKVTERNFISVANWSGGMAISKMGKGPDAEETNQRVRIRNSDGVRVSNVDDYVYRTGEKGAYVFWSGKKDWFEANFEL